MPLSPHLLFAILKPTDKIEGIGEDEALVFEIVEGEEHATIDAKGKLTALAEGKVVVKKFTKLNLNEN